MFVITGNTFNTGGNWMGGEAIIRLQAGPVFKWSPRPTENYWAPTNWLQLDNGDTDLGGVSAMLIDVPSANPSQLVLALGKDGNAYLLDRNNLGGIAAPVAQLSVDGVIRGQSSATYRTSQGTYFVFRGSNEIKGYKITATSPPSIVFAWSVSQTGRARPGSQPPMGPTTRSCGLSVLKAINGYTATTVTLARLFTLAVALTN